jgi:hypothetical protein
MWKLGKEESDLSKKTTVTSKAEAAQGGHNDAKKCNKTTALLR